MRKGYVTMAFATVQEGQRSSLGFVRTDAVGLIGVLVLPGTVVWAGIWLSGERRRVYVCANEMRRLGRAFTEYAQAHQDKLPPAVLDVRSNSTSCDAEIAGYLEPALARHHSAKMQKQLEAKIASLFHCPSDTELRGTAVPRGYSMLMHDINKAVWPPEPNGNG